MVQLCILRELTEISVMQLHNYGTGHRNSVWYLVDDLDLTLSTTFMKSSSDPLVVAAI